MKLHPDVISKQSIKSFEVLEHKFRAVHGDRYDYSLVEYKGDGIKIDIICKKHGTFFQTPGNHKQGQGCPYCIGKNKTTEQFIEEARETHGDVYDYSLVEYNGCSKEVDIICPTHGVFSQIPFVHISGSGCKNCGTIKQAQDRIKTTEQFIKEAREVHGELFDYSLVDYKFAINHVDIICSIHGVFHQTPNSHINMKSGCTYCARERTNYDKYKDKKTTLYYIKIDDVYKVGLTKTSLKNRFKKELEEGINVEVIKTIDFEDGWEAFQLEQQILKETNHLRIKKKESPIEGGWTEVRKEDIIDFVESKTVE